MAKEAFAHEAEILRRMRRQQIANTFAIVILVLGILALAAYYIVRSDAWQRPTPPRTKPPEIVVDPPPPPPTTPATATELAAPASVAKPAFVDPRPQITPLPIPGPAPIVSDNRLPPRETERRPAPREPRIVTGPTTTGPDALGFTSSAPAKRVLVSIKCFDQFAFEREEGGRQYFSAICESGFRRQVSCAGAGCRIEYDPPPSH